MADVRVTSIQKIVDVAPDADLQLGGVYGLVDYAADTTIQAAGIYGLVDYSVPANLELGGIYLLVEAEVNHVYTVTPDSVVFTLTIPDPTITAITDQRPDPVAINLTLTTPTTSYIYANSSTPDPLQLELTLVTPTTEYAVDMVTSPNSAVIRFTTKSATASYSYQQLVTNSHVLVGSPSELEFTLPDPIITHTRVATVAATPVAIKFAATTSFDFQLEVEVDSYVFVRPQPIQFTATVITTAHTRVSFVWIDPVAIDFVTRVTEVTYEVATYPDTSVIPGSFGIYFTVPDPVVIHVLAQSRTVDPVRIMFDGSISDDGYSWVFADTVAVSPVRFNLRVPSTRLITVPPSDVIWPPLLLPNSYFH